MTFGAYSRQHIGLRALGLWWQFQRHCHSMLVEAVKHIEGVFYMVNSGRDSVWLPRIHAAKPGLQIRGSDGAAEPSAKRLGQRA